MLILPLLYLGVIALAAYAVYWHAVHNVAIFDGTRGMLWRAVAYVMPLIAGSTMVLFLIKPLFAKRIARSAPYTIEPSQEPGLFKFVEQVASCVGAPQPRVVQVNCDPNAHAAFRRGWWSMFGDDLVLCIGMPLVAGLNMRQLAGVLAHELGHFSQRAGMRLTFIIQAIGAWFARIVYERDAWDEKLVQLANSESYWILQLSFQFARLCVWLSRRILWLFMVASRVISCFMLRQMEFNADLHQARLAGGGAFETTSRRIVDLGSAAGYVESTLRESAAAGRLADDLPRQIAALADHIPPHVGAHLEQSFQQRTGILDTHPSWKDRIAHVMKDDAPGVFTLEQPASKLFQNFPVLCKWTTIGHYQVWLGRDVNPDHLTPTDKIIETFQIDSRGNQAFAHYFQDIFSPIRIIVLDDPFTGPAPVESEEMQRLRRARAQVESCLSAARDASKRLEEIDGRLLKIHHAEQLAAAGIKDVIPDLTLHSRAPAALRSKRDAAQQDRQRALHDLTPFECATRERLYAAMRLLRCPEIAARINRANKIVSHVEAVYRALATMCEVHPSLMDLRRQVILMAALCAAASSAADDALVNKLHNLSVDVHRLVTSLRNQLHGAAYPLEHSRQGLTLDADVCQSIPAAHDIGALMSAAIDAMERATHLYPRLLGRLALVAERIEKLAGLSPLPEPPRTEEPNRLAK